MNEQELEKLIPYQNGQAGAFEDRFDSRDYVFDEEIFGAVEIPWEQGWDIETELNTKIKIEDQGNSLSCVGQSWQKYAEVLNQVETGEFKDLSTKFIYSQIYLPSGGSYIRNGGKIVVNQGVSTEALCASYTSDGHPLTEDAFRQSEDITEGARKEALIYQAKEYRAMPKNNINAFAAAIMQNWGCVSGAIGTNEGWRMPEGKVNPPKAGENTWGHAFYCSGLGQDDRGKYITFINSWSDKWGNNGKGRLYEDYFQSGSIFSPWTLIDKTNVEESMEIETIKVGDKPEIFAKSRTEKKLYWVGGWESYNEFKKAGWMKEVEVVANLDGYEIVWQPLGFIK